MNTKQETQGHTPGKWVFHDGETQGETGRITNGTWSAQHIADVMCADLEDGSANGNRIVACVNAMQGIPDPERWVAEVREAVDVMEFAARIANSVGLHETASRLNGAVAALAEKGTVDNGK